MLGCILLVSVPVYLPWHSADRCSSVPYPEVHPYPRQFHTKTHFRRAQAYTAKRRLLNQGIVA